MLKRSSPGNCKMTFFIGRGNAECQILKKWKWPYLLNWVEYFDKLLRKHWYWQDLAQEIAKWHFHPSRLCRAPNSEKVIKALSLELSGILWWNFAYTLILTRCTPWDCQMTFEIGWVFAEVQILKIVRLLQNDIYHRSRLCRAPNSEKVKMALSLELSGILWWNFAYTLVLTRCSPWDCQMTFGIDRGFAEVQILKKVKFNSLTVWNILIKFCRQFDVEKI